MYMLCESSIILQNLLAYCYQETSAIMLCTQLCSDYINEVMNSFCLDDIYSTSHFEGLMKAFVELCESH
jgi:phage-related holin